MKLKFLLVLVVLGCYGCKNEINEPSSILNFVPENAGVIVKINDISRLKSELKNNTFLSAVNNTRAYRELSEKAKLLDFIKSDTTALLAYIPSTTDSTEALLVVPQAAAIKISDSLSSSSKPSFSYKGVTIDNHILNNQDFFSTYQEDFLLIASSRALLENVIESGGSQETDKTLTALFDISNSVKSATVFIKTKFSKGIESNNLKDTTSVHLADYSEWLSLDLDSHPDKLKLNGIALAQDSTKHFVNLFKQIPPIVLATPSVAPSDADAILAFSLIDYERFAENQKEYLSNTFVLDSLFNGVEEIGHIYLDKQSAIVLHTYASENISEFLQNNTTVTIDFQGNEISGLSKNEFLNNFFDPLISNFDARFYTVLENAFVFSADQLVLQKIVSSYKRNSVFTSSPLFKTLQPSLADESNILIISNSSGLDKLLKEDFSAGFIAELNTTKISNFAFGTQIIADHQFFHTNMVVKEIGSNAADNSISQVFSLQLDAELNTDPQFVINHRTAKQEIVVQDIENNLYLISTAGKVLWKKKLNAKIQGNISQVDLYKNGRLQLAFTTSDQFIILDRNGKEVGPFNMKFEGGNLNPLSVFDYDKTKNYRFVITQGTNVFMYNSKGNIVNGFKYTKAEANVLFAPRHFRIGRRDYLVFQLENGKLMILTREGKIRVAVKENISFSENEVMLYKNKFTLTDKNGTLIVIDEKGGISGTKFNFNEDHGTDATSKTLVSINDNVLTIKGKKVTLDLGVYTKPKIFYLYDKIYVGVTDLQTERVYLFDSNAKSISNFPVMGSTLPDMSDMDNDRKVELLTKENSNSLVVYKIN
ncbi:ribonuclease HII [Muriicola sp. Z0-33]|uniref:ribonuclease HII n=1 Tax=Muriicola sp. Z0-33 TaxID=2816957 RepID=UPI002238A9DE|nr:ribonuclease HII [Muriicola sp. Z0-33]MCW5517897.1 ribonuclease HII [Muriicola sp. Z0-33]